MCDYILRVKSRDGRVYQTNELDRDDAIALAAVARRHGDTSSVRRECQGHPAGAYDPLGVAVYCDGSCQPTMD